MSIKHYLAIALILSLLPTHGLHAEEAKDASSSPVVGFWGNTLKSHTGWNSLWHLGALGATGVMIIGQVDQDIADADKNYFGDAFNTGALVVGTWWHILPAAIVYWTTDDEQNKYAAASVVQAVGSTFLVTTTEKLVLGRAFIDKGDDRGPSYLPFRKSTDARDFYPFQNLGGLWPSGHTATAFAAASALTSFYKNDESFVKIAVLTYAASAFMGYAMIDGNIHWASDVVAGALIGHAIGWTIGKDFRSRYNRSAATRTANTTVRPSFVPLISNYTYGFMVNVKY
jgi:membrane-associated phospholipid phosphatase